MFRWSLLVLFACAGACTLAVDTDSLSEGCGAGTKLCDGVCVSATDPENGCGRTSCLPCTLPQARSLCGSTGQCTVATCNGTYQDCDGNSANGCEVDINSDPQRCGSCNASPCDLGNAEPDCAGGTCAIRRCLTGYRDCDERADNGCEIRITSDALNCGACGERCGTGQQCVSGSCE